MTVMEKALRLARGKWQRRMVRTGYDRLRGAAKHYYCGSYYQSLEGLAKRLKREGIPARIFMPERGRFYFIYGEDWVRLFDNARNFKDKLVKIRENLDTLVNQNPQLRKALSSQHVFATLRSLNSKAFYVVWDIAADFTDWLEVTDEERKERIWQEAQERLENLKREFENFVTRTRLGVVFL